MAKQIKTYHLNNQTVKNVHEIACKCSEKLQAGDIIFLKGPIGVGKTFFARSLIINTLKSQKLWDEVPSPSFSLIQMYDNMTPPICHVDLYRLSFLSELEELGLEDLYKDSVTLIEWPERLESRLPTRFFQIEFSFIKTMEDRRNLSIVSRGSNWDHVFKSFIKDFKEI